MDIKAEPIELVPADPKSSDETLRASQPKRPVDPPKRGRRAAGGPSLGKETAIKARTVRSKTEIASTTAKTKKNRKFLGEDPSNFAPLILSPLQKEPFDMSRPEKFDTSKLAADSSQVADDVAKLARAAIDAIRAATDEFASKAGVSRGEAVDAVRNAGQAAVNGIGSVAGEARAMTETGLDTLGKSVIRNPLAALAIAAGTGLLLGLLSRSGQDNRR